MPELIDPFDLKAVFCLIIRRNAKPGAAKRDVNLNFMPTAVQALPAAA